MGGEPKDVRPKGKQSDVPLFWFGLVALIAAVNVLYSTIFLAPTLGTENEGLLSKVGGAHDTTVAVSLDEENAHGLTPILIRNNLNKNISIRLDIELQDGVVFRDAMGKHPQTDVATQRNTKDPHTWHFVVSEHDIEPTETAIELAWIGRKTKNIPWSVHIEHSAQKMVRGKRSGFWGGTVTGGSEQPFVAHRHFNTHGIHHSAAHGLFFDIRAKDRPVMITGLRFSALSCYQRGASAPPAHVRVWSSYKGDFGNDGYEEREWYLLGEEYNLEVLAQPFLTEITMQPAYIAAHQTLSLAIHSDFPFGISQRVPTIEGLSQEIHDDHQGSFFAPKWLSLALEPSPIGVRRSEAFLVLPGLAMGKEPLKTAAGTGARSFVGLVQYRVIGLYDAQDHGLSQLLQHHSTWFQHQRTGKHHHVRDSQNPEHGSSQRRKDERGGGGSEGSGVSCLS